MSNGMNFPLQFSILSFEIYPQCSVYWIIKVMIMIILVYSNNVM